MSDLYFHQLDGDSNKIPIYLLHTIPLDSSYLIKSLQTTKQVNTMILIDLPSHGKSNDMNEKDLTFVNIAKAIDHLREKLLHQTIIIYGHGIGGFVAQQYAIKYQKYLSGIILSNTAPNAKYRKAMAWNIRERYSKATKHALDGYYGKTDDKSIRARFTQSLAVYFTPTNHEAAEELLNDCERIASKAYIHLSQHVIPNFELREQLRKISVITLLITGKTDVMPERSTLLLKNDIIHAKLIELKSGHFPMIEQPESYWYMINDWINLNS